MLFRSWNKIFWYFIFLVTLAAAYFFIAPYLFTFLFPQYLEAVRYSQIYILWILALAFDPINSYISSRKHLKTLYASTVVYSLSKIALLVIGVLFWGLMGVIVARIATHFIVIVFNYTLYRRVLRADIGETA